MEEKDALHGYDQMTDLIDKLYSKNKKEGCRGCK